jgi:hypothetical protein
MWYAANPGEMLTTPGYKKHCVVFITGSLLVWSLVWRRGIFNYLI